MRHNLSLCLIRGLIPSYQHIITFCLFRHLNCRQASVSLKKKDRHPCLSTIYQRQPAPPPKIRAAVFVSRTKILVFMEEGLLFMGSSSQTASIGKELSAPLRPFSSTFLLGCRSKLIFRHIPVYRGQRGLNYGVIFIASDHR